MPAATDGGPTGVEPRAGGDAGAATSPTSPTSPHVVVIGGGISGLAAAWELVTAVPGIRVTVAEASARLGGKIVGAPFAGRRIDLGADAFVARRPEAVALCQELGLAGDLVPPSSRSASVQRGGRLRPLPDGLALGVPTRLLPLARSGLCSPLGVARAGLDLLVPPIGRRRPPADAAVGTLVGRRLGRQVVEVLTDPLIGGIHAGSVHTMSAAAVFPPLLHAAGDAGSLMRNLRRHVPAPDPSVPVFLTLPGGLSVLVARLVDELVARGVDIRTRAPAHGLQRRDGWQVQWANGSPEQADAVVVAVPGGPGAALAAESAPALAALLGRIRYASVALVTMRLSRAALPAVPAGTGYLVPRREGRLLTACTFMTSKWAHLARADDHLVRVSVGRDGDDGFAAFDDDELVRRVTSELGSVLGLRDGPAEATVTRFVDAFPQYDVGHLTWVEQVERAAADAGRLAVAGAALRGVGIPACIGSGRRAARTVLASLGVTAEPTPGWHPATEPTPPTSPR